MQHPQSRARSSRWIRRGALVVLVGAAMFGVSPALPAVADQAGTFVYADSTGNAFTFTAGATGFGTGIGSHTHLGDLKIVPGQAVLLASDAVSAEPVS